MKKWLKATIISISIALGISVATITPLLVLKFSKDSNNSNGNNEQNTKKILTKDVVNSNFDSNGKWQNRLFLNADDFNGYNSLAFDAFDGLPYKLEYVEIPSNIIIHDQGSGGDFNNSIKWENVNEIRSKNIDNSNNFWVEDEIVFIKDYETGNIIASTISNRTKKQTLFFPCFQSTNLNNNIVDFAYNIYYSFFTKENEFIFKNVDRVCFYDSIDSTYAIEKLFLYDYANKLQEKIDINNFTSIAVSLNIMNLESFNLNIVDINDSSIDHEQEKIVDFWNEFLVDKISNLSITSESNKNTIIFLSNVSPITTTSKNFNFNLDMKNGELVLVNGNYAQSVGWENNQLIFNRLEIIDNNNSSIEQPKKLIPFERFNMSIKIDSEVRNGISTMNFIQYLIYKIIKIDYPNVLIGWFDNYFTENEFMLEPYIGDINNLSIRSSSSAIYLQLTEKTSERVQLIGNKLDASSIKYV